MVDVLVVLRNLYANKRDYAKAVYDYITESFNLKNGASLIGRQDVELVNSWLSNAPLEIDPLITDQSPDDADDMDPPQPDSTLSRRTPVRPRTDTGTGTRQRLKYTGPSR